jgi:dihydroxyacetone kinase
MVKPKKILNKPEDSVDEFLEGLLLQYPNHLQRLENHHVVLAAKRDAGCVHLISGGGSGHEPSHAGWIGQGMLSAAVCGGIFASPSVAAVLAAIQAVAQTENAKGVLLIIKNYTGDRLNFGVAAERANLSMSVPVRTIVVADDCALPRQKGVTGARGVAGTVLVHKITGAAAAAGLTLDECHAVAKRVCSRIGTLGIALNTVTVPGASSVNDRLADDDTIEIGLGIHGEAGLKQSKMMTADEMAAEMVQTIQSYGRIGDGEDQAIVPFFTAGDEVVILVNNLGGTSNFEMSVLARSCVKLLEGSDYQVKASRVLVGSYMTSFDMHGVSLTIMNVSGQDDLLQYLDTPCTAPAWSKCDVWKTESIRPSDIRLVEARESGAAPSLALPPCAIPDFSQTASKVLKSAVTALEQAEPLLTKYDTIVGDGDCGLTMKRGALHILQELQNGKLATGHPVSLFSDLSRAVSASMGGTSGILLELLLGKVASTLAQKPQTEISSVSLAHAFQEGVHAVQLYGGATVGSRTMLDALIPASEAWTSLADFSHAVRAARKGANGTAEMDTASAGRSNYLSQESLQGTPDPGAIAVAIVLEACAAVLG